MVALSAQAASIAITDTVSDTVGTTAVIPGSGEPFNTNTWSVGRVGLFNVNIGGSAGYLQVEASNPTGALSAGTNSLMVARTVNSQGLTDAGTLSVYVRPTSENNWNLDLRFSFWQSYDAQTSSVSGPINLTLKLTSLDIDFNQLYYVADADFGGGSVTYAPTNITSAPFITGFTGFTSPANSVFNDPENAVTSTGTGETFNIRLRHDSVALFMFEFRDPPTIIPEPSSAVALAGMAVLGAAGLRRRRRA